MLWKHTETQTWLHLPRWDKRWELGFSWKQPSLGLLEWAKVRPIELEQNVINEEGPYKYGMRPYEICLLCRWPGTALGLVNTVVYLGASETHSSLASWRTFLCWEFFCQTAWVCVLAQLWTMWIWPVSLFASISLCQIFCSIFIYE